MNGPTIDEATEVFYEHYNKANGDETCYQAVRRAMAHVIEYVARSKADSKPTVWARDDDQMEIDQCLQEQRVHLLRDRV